MKITALKKEIKRIGKIENLLEMKKELDKLTEVLRMPKFEKRISGNYVYFYEMKGYYDKTTQNWKYTNQKNLGKLELSDYTENKDYIDSLSYEGLVLLLKSSNKN